MLQVVLTTRNQASAMDVLGVILCSGGNFDNIIWMQVTVYSGTVYKSTMQCNDI